MKKKYDFDWNALIEEQPASGMNMKAYCGNIAKDV